MPAPPLRTDNWANGANNVAKPERLPEGFVRDLVNVDPTEGGQLDLRAGYERIVETTDMRLAVALGDRVVFVDGGALKCYSSLTDSVQALGSVTPLGEIAGVAFNGQVYLAGVHDSLRTDGVSVKSWAVPAPAFGVELIDGSLPAGIYKVAVTASGADGEESGVEPFILRVSEGQALRVSSVDPRSLRVYVSPANGATLYSQGPLIGGAMALTAVDDQTERLTTTGCVPMPACAEYAAYHGVIVGRRDNAVFVSLPRYPHLMDPVKGFFQYGAPVTALAATDGGLFVATSERTHFLTGLETDQASQRVVLDIGAVSGTAVALPDGRAAWFTRYGLAIGAPDGSVSLPNQKTYAPDLATQGAAGVFEHNGKPLVVTTMRGVTRQNNLMAGDFAELEIDDGH